MKDLDLKEFYEVSGYEGLNIDLKPKFEYRVSPELIALN